MRTENLSFNEAINRIKCFNLPGFMWMSGSTALRKVVRDEVFSQYDTGGRKLSTYMDGKVTEPRWKVVV